LEILRTHFDYPKTQYSSLLEKGGVMRLKDKVAIVTGGAKGIGKAFVMGFSKEGAKVAVVTDLSLKAADETAAEVIKKGGEALVIRADVSNLEDTREMARKTIEHFGGIDILVNNAAIFGSVPIKHAPFYELEMSEWDRTWEVNVKGVFLCCRAVFPQMREQGSGKIINISSTQFYRGGTQYVKYAHYVAQKGAIIGLTRALARELGEHNINVNCIAPGGTLTEDPTDKAALEKRKKAAERRSIMRVEYPDDLVGAAIFLASGESAFITGQTIVIDGGDVMI
jgi:3-oxoacyl-[acyl-carrier protein] reductase